MAAYLDLEWLRKENFVKMTALTAESQKSTDMSLVSRTALDLSCCLVGEEVCAYFLAERQDKAEMKCEASLQK